MISTPIEKLARSLRWIAPVTIAWLIVIAIYAHRAPVRPLDAMIVPPPPPDDSAAQLRQLQSENQRLRNELTNLPALKSQVQQLTAPRTNAPGNLARWNAQSNLLHAAIEAE